MIQLIKLLTDKKLRGDSLQDLELFFDGILSTFNTVAPTSELYPKYRGLPKSFDFYHHLCQLDCTILLSFPDQHQARVNYKSFGAGLHHFLLNPCTVRNNCPDSYLQLPEVCYYPPNKLLILIYQTSPLTSVTTNPLHP